jgi:hypothetical protein
MTVKLIQISSQNIRYWNYFNPHLTHEVCCNLFERYRAAAVNRLSRDVLGRRGIEAGVAAKVKKKTEKEQLIASVFFVRSAVVMVK